MGDVTDLPERSALDIINEAAVSLGATIEIAEALVMYLPGGDDPKAESLDTLTRHLRADYEVLQSAIDASQRAERMETRRHEPDGGAT